MPCFGRILKTENNKFYGKLYEISEALLFTIVSIPYLDCNIPSKLLHGTYGTKMLKITEITCNKADLIKHSKRLITRVIKQGCL